MKYELPLYRHVQREEIRKAELPRAGNDLAKLVDSHKAKTGAPDAGRRQIKLLELPRQRIRSPGSQLIRSVPWQHSSRLISHQESVNGKVHRLI